jgi:hypothetical protein
MLAEEVSRCRVTDSRGFSFVCEIAKMNLLSINSNIGTPSLKLLVPRDAMILRRMLAWHKELRVGIWREIRLCILTVVMHCTCIVSSSGFLFSLIEAQVLVLSFPSDPGLPFARILVPGDTFILASTPTMLLSISCVLPMVYYSQITSAIIQRIMVDVITDLSISDLKTENQSVHADGAALSVDPYGRDSIALSAQLPRIPANKIKVFIINQGEALVAGERDPLYHVVSFLSVSHLYAYYSTSVLHKQTLVA